MESEFVELLKDLVAIFTLPLLFAGLIVSIAGLIVSIRSLKRQLKRDKKQEFDEKRADISAEFLDPRKIGDTFDGEITDFRIVLTNTGKSTAQNVRVYCVDGKDKESNPRPAESFKNNSVSLDKGDSRQLIERLAVPLNAHYFIKVMWDDETGKDHCKSIHP